MRNRWPLNEHCHCRTCWCSTRTTNLLPGCSATKSHPTCSASVDRNRVLRSRCSPPLEQYRTLPLSDLARAHGHIVVCPMNHIGRDAAAGTARLASRPSVGACPPSACSEGRRACFFFPLLEQRLADGKPNTQFANGIRIRAPTTFGGGGGSRQRSGTRSRTRDPQRPGVRRGQRHDSGLGAAPRAAGDRMGVAEAPPYQSLLARWNPETLTFPRLRWFERGRVGPRTLRHPSRRV